MGKACDIAWSKPSGSALHSAGVTVASLYVGQDTSGKNMTNSVVADYTSHGVGVVTNFEYGASQMANGAPQGTSDARLGLSQKRVCGIPDDRPIYYSADWNATTAQIQSGVIPYLVAARAVTGPGTVGVYGSYYVVSAVHAYWAQHFPGEKVWLWQTTAWSNGNKFPGIDMYQDGTTFTVAGVSLDNDVLLSVDVGQYPAPATSTTLPEEDVLILRVTGDTSVYALDGGVLWGVSDPTTLQSYLDAGTKQATVSPSEIQRIQAVQPVAATVTVDSSAVAKAVGDAVAAALANLPKAPTAFTGTLS